MPSQKSLQNRQYYAHPQNSFWWLMSQLCGFDAGASYKDRVANLTNFGIAVWDVLYDCERSGSLDAKIVKASEQPNDLCALIDATPSIKLIAFNGAAAEQIFVRHLPSFSTDYPSLKTVRIPSSSPAHASINREQKLDLWRAAMEMP